MDYRVPSAASWLQFGYTVGGSMTGGALALGCIVLVEWIQRKRRAKEWSR